MRVSEDEFILLKDKSSQILKELDELMLSMKGVVPDKFLYDENPKQYKMLYKIGKILYTYKDMGEFPHIIISYLIGGKIDSLEIRVNVDVVKQKSKEVKSFWGKVSTEVYNVIDCRSKICYPLVSSHDIMSRDLYCEKSASLDFDNFYDSILKNGSDTEVDKETLQKLKYFVNNQISIVSEAVLKKKSAINRELGFLDQDNNGKVDVIESKEFSKLLQINQSKIISIDRNYVHKFIKLSNYINKRKENIQTIFASIQNNGSIKNKVDALGILKNQIHSYDLLIFHSLNMIGALVNDDLIVFYEIYESFDKLGIFNSNWENEVSEKLTNIETRLDDLIYSINNMEQNIISELNHLSYVTQDSFSDLNRSVISQLKEVESSINMNNLLTGIQTYQLYKINKQTKRP